jgi:hypothetical protein
METVGPRPFRNWGDWLISRSTGALGDFRIGTCTSIINAEKWSRGWVQQITYQDVQRILARYKEHVTYWNTVWPIVEKELAEFSTALGWNYTTVVQMFYALQPTRFPPEFEGTPESPHW